MINILTVIGARPQIIKSAAINRAVKNKFNDQISEKILHTGQHYDEEMSAFFFDELQIQKPDFNLKVGSSSHGKQTAQMMEGIEKVTLELKPDAILVYGDTNSTLAAALVGSKLHIPVIHVEAGLRSFDKSMPEEINRITTDHCSTLLFSPTKTGVDNLKKEGFVCDNIKINSNNPGVYHVGDVMYDNSIYYSTYAQNNSEIIQNNFLEENDYILVTVHRDSNTDDPQKLINIVNAFVEVSEQKNTKIVWPIHPRVKNLLNKPEYEKIADLINNTDSFIILPPTSFFDIIQLEQNARLIITDSGGVQKEAYFFNKPTVILRPHTEWVELVESKHAILCGSDKQKIVAGAAKMWSKRFDSFPEVFGKGKAAEEICEIIIKTLSAPC